MRTDNQFQVSAEFSRISSKNDSMTFIIKGKACSPAYYEVAGTREEVPFEERRSWIISDSHSPLFSKLNRISFQLVTCEMCITKACEEPTAVGIWWRDDAEWKQYDAPQAAAIQRGIADRANRVELGNLVGTKYPGGAQYVVDLCTMKQINVASRFTRDIKVVKADPATAVTAAVTTSDDISTVKELRTYQKSIWSLKKVLKLETDLLTVKFALKKEFANQVSANINIASAKPVAKLKQLERA